MLEHLVILEALFTGVVVAAFALGVGRDKIDGVTGAGKRRAARMRLRVENAVAAFARGGVVLVGAVDAVAGDIALETETGGFAVLENVFGLQGFHLHHATDGARCIGAQAWAFIDGDVADQVGVDVAALLHAAVTAIGVNRLLAAVDGHRYAALALNATDVHVQRAAVAGVTGLHARHALENVGRGGAAKAIDGLAGDVHAGARLGVNLRGRAGQAAALATFDGHGAEQFRFVQITVQAGAGLAARAEDQAALAVDFPADRRIAEQLAQGLFVAEIAAHGRGLQTIYQPGRQTQLQIGLTRKSAEGVGQRLGRDIEETGSLITRQRVGFCRHRRGRLENRAVDCHTQYGQRHRYFGVRNV